MADLREEYDQPPIDLDQLADDPIVQFGRWFDEARAAKTPQANAMSLATVDADGTPSARIVLMKLIEAAGIVFFTNYQSRKARAMESTGKAAAVFYWEPIDRQVRFEGRVLRIPESESDAYFATRPRGSQIGAWTSPQSQRIESLEVLEARREEMEARFGDGPVPRPPFWGGYTLEPTVMEFWQGRTDRLHDRVRYEWGKLEGWVRWRVAP